MSLLILQCNSYTRIYILFIVESSIHVLVSVWHTVVYELLNPFATILSDQVRLPVRVPVRYVRRRKSAMIARDSAWSHRWHRQFLWLGKSSWIELYRDSIHPNETISTKIVPRAYLHDCMVPSVVISFCDITPKYNSVIRFRDIIRSHNCRNIIPYYNPVI